MNDDIRGPLSFFSSAIGGAIDQGRVNKARREQKRDREQALRDRRRAKWDRFWDRRRAKRDRRIQEARYRRAQAQMFRQRWIWQPRRNWWMGLDEWEKQLHRASYGAVIVVLAGYLFYLVSTIYGGTFLRQLWAAPSVPEHWVPALVIGALLLFGGGWLAFGIGRTKWSYRDARLISHSLYRLAFAFVIAWATRYFIPDYDWAGYGVAAFYAITALVKLALLLKAPPSMAGRDELDEQQAHGGAQFVEPTEAAKALRGGHMG